MIEHVATLNRTATMDHRRNFVDPTRAFLAWLPIVGLPTAAALAVPADWPRWVLMWMLAFAVYLGGKWLAWQKASLGSANWRQGIAWWLAWPGMDPTRFMSKEPLSAGQKPEALEWFAAGSKIVLGVVMFVAAGRLLNMGWEVAGAWLGMVGFIVTVHCGVFHLLSCVWRSRGMDARTLMDRPIAARSLAEFWSRRWNRAFRDMGYAAVYRPLVRRFGSTAAILAVFLFSGIVHETVITLSAGAGYGLPTAYFLLQGLAVVMEDSSVGKRMGLGRGWLGRAFALVVIVAPLPLLFPPPFVEGVVVPFLQAVCVS
jgi:hypothetical protein